MWSLKHSMSNSSALCAIEKLQFGAGHHLILQLSSTYESAANFLYVATSSRDASDSVYVVSQITIIINNYFILTFKIK